MSHPVCDSVIYLWRSRKNFSTEFRPLPEKEFAFFRLNANAYSKISPNTKFILWVDDERTLDAFKDEIAQMQNIRVCKISEIFEAPEFSKLQPFMEGLEDVWIYNDLIRLLAIQYRQKVCGDGSSLYTDFDAPRVHIDHSEFKKRIDTYGLVLGGTYNYSDEKDRSMAFENGYFAVGLKGQVFLEFIITGAIQCVRDASVRPSGLVYGYIQNTLREIGEGKLSVPNWDVQIPSNWEQTVGGLYALPREHVKLNAKLITDDIFAEIEPRPDCWERIANRRPNTAIWSYFVFNQYNV